ncbi:MAG: radical SAM protein [Bacteroidales bacterium]|jgi:wyosine [tRNA(Phe)-imidazoG37] synthetase (radical SAM superfamily)|nr:radical SAM protein [Bacteroidales bacterium]MDD4672943.1 radical SAM protein [Bacteroidales bacterium]MDY0348907.1 radical SAM protein [Tenuifilaceae bacterium]
MICFGPIPSRRLGKSLGINNICDKKICTYSCVYCQVGAKQRYSIERELFYEPKQIYMEVESHLGKLNTNDIPDFLTFVANGEPTLDKNLGESIQLLKKFSIPIAVITNGSLLYNADVRAELAQADWVSVKCDTANQRIWSKLNRPISKLNFNTMCSGMLSFANQYRGTLVTETMLVDEVNDHAIALERTACQVYGLSPSIAYLSIPTRPPAVSTVKPSTPEAINEAYQIFDKRGLNTELILGFEGTDTGYTGNAAEDILNICAVHPIREDTMRELLAKNNSDYSVLYKLIEEDKVVELEFDSKKFYLRKH